MDLTNAESVEVLTDNWLLEAMHLEDEETPWASILDAEAPADRSIAHDWLLSMFLPDLNEEPAAKTDEDESQATYSDTAEAHDSDSSAVPHAVEGAAKNARASVSPATDSRSASCQTRKSAPKNSSRERIKAETAALRSQVNELERQARELHAHNAKKEALIVTQDMAWKPVADRQKEQRQRAEAENARLTHLLNHHLSVAKSLESFLQKRARGTSIEDECAGVSMGSVSRPIKRERPNHAANMLFARFTREIDERLYPKVNEVFADVLPGRITVSDSQRQPTVKSEGKDLYIESRDQKWVPFDYERASTAIWEAVQQVFLDSDSNAGAASLDGDCITVAARHCYGHGQNERTLSTAMMMKRFVEANRMVLVWCGMSSVAAIDAERGETPVLPNSDDCGWAMMQPVPESPTGLMPGTALCTICSRCTPFIRTKEQRDSVLGQLRSGDFSQVVVKSITSEVLAVAEGLENILLGDTLALNN